ncbi:hypothetical protein [Pseudomonas sp. P42]|uniref:hypothetical protein n=1 Tax=Pseudomonas sp. P42 TaxID=1080160 RepID=UPI001B3200F6|nr:hypothetical protein [Pseudomonas sp. P42]MBP5950046.1 hypothetical protein [Pseudomonas sp. P42]
MLKKTTTVFTVEKYALEIEFFTLSRGFRAQISRSGTQIRRFQRSVCGQSGRTGFFNRIGLLLPTAKSICGVIAVLVLDICITNWLERYAPAHQFYGQEVSKVETHAVEDVVREVNDDIPRTITGLGI